MKNVLIGGAWPYANGSLHIGHIAGLLPGDVLARYHRAIGDQVYFVSGSDCHGTPVAIRAKQENKTPQEVSDYYHEEFVECFYKLGFSYDCYTKTSAKEHQDFVRDFHKKLYESPYVYEKEAPQAYCESCESFLADRFVLGKCPKCGADTRGDQCDACGTVLEPEALVNPFCAVCGKPVSFRSSKHLYIAISKLKEELTALVDAHPDWRKNAIAFTNRYINDGLRDRALTRDLESRSQRKAMRIRRSISGQKMCLVICLPARWPQKNEVRISTSSGARMQSIIMFTERITFLFTRSFCRRFLLQMGRGGICLIRSSPANIARWRVARSPRVRIMPSG